MFYFDYINRNSKKAPPNIWSFFIPNILYLLATGRDFVFTHKK